MGWFYLFIAIVFEVVGTTQLKRTEGNFFTSAGMMMLFFYAISFFMLTLALKNDIEVGVGYAIWSGVGTALIAIIGVLVFAEQASVMKFLCIVMIIMGVVGLKLNTFSPNKDDKDAGKQLVSEIPPEENASKTSCGIACELTAEAIPQLPNLNVTSPSVTS